MKSILEMEAEEEDIGNPNSYGDEMPTITNQHCEMKDFVLYPSLICSAFASQTFLRSRRKTADIDVLCKWKICHGASLCRGRMVDHQSPVCKFILNNRVTSECSLTE